jgi:hypothetical protein
MPLGEYMQHLYLKRFGRPRPDGVANVRSEGERKRREQLIADVVRLRTATLETALAQSTAMNFVCWHSLTTVFLADAVLRAGQPPNAERIALRAVELARRRAPRPRNSWPQAPGRQLRARRPSWAVTRRGHIPRGAPAGGTPRHAPARGTLPPCSRGPPSADGDRRDDLPQAEHAEVRRAGQGAHDEIG